MTTINWFNEDFFVPGWAKQLKSFWEGKWNSVIRSRTLLDMDEHFWENPEWENNGPQGEDQGHWQGYLPGFPPVFFDDEKQLEGDQIILSPSCLEEFSTPSAATLDFSVY